MSEQPRQLPIIKMGNKSFFLDERLKELRNIKNPHDKIDFNDLEYCESETCSFCVLQHCIKQGQCSEL